MRHDQELERESGEYWACERPESPPDTGIWWDEQCAGCVMMYDAAIANGLGREFVLFTDDGKVVDMEDAPIRQWKEMGLVEG